MTLTPASSPATHRAAATTQDGAALTPLAGGFLPPYADRLSLIAHLPAPSVDSLSVPGEDSEMGAPFDAEQAALLDQFNAPFGPAEPTHAQCEERQIDGPHGPITVRIYRPESGWQPPLPSPEHEGRRAGLVWYHGGAFVGGDLDMPEADLVSRGLCTRTGAVVVSVDYRLCNDGRTHFPVPHDDAYAAFRWIQAHAQELGIDPERVAVGGASAGGNLACSVALHGRDDAAAEAGVAPWQALLAYPVAHCDPWPTPSAELAARLEQMPQVLRFPADIMAGLNTNFLGGEPTGAPAYAYPGDGEGSAADLSGYPCTYIENSENDDLRSSGEAFGAALAQAGVDVECVTAAGTPHGHLNAVGSPLTAQSLDRFAARLARPRPGC